MTTAIKGGPKVRRQEGRLKTVTSLASFLREAVDEGGHGGLLDLPVGAMEAF
jgi:hypothetical protein